MPRVFVAGCGFVGLATARLFRAAGWDVIGGVHSAKSVAQLAREPFPVHVCDVTDRTSVAALANAGELDSVIHCASSGRGGADEYRAVYLEGARILGDLLQPKTLLFTSSTSVYPQTSGEWVTEGSPAEPDRATGRVLRETEELVLGRGGVVARLAGIYGPGRSVLLRRFFRGEATIEGDGARFVNQVHRDDIATALIRLIQQGARGVFNVADNAPMTQRALYEWLAAHFAKPVPPYGPMDPNRKRGWTNKRVSNAKLRDLGWAPRYASFRDAVMLDAALLAAVEAQG